MWQIDIQIGIQTRIRPCHKFFSPIFPLRCLCCSLPAIVLSPSVPNQGSGVWSGVTMWQCYFTGWRGEVRWGEGGPPGTAAITILCQVSSPLVTPYNNNNTARKKHTVQSSPAVLMSSSLPGDPTAATISGDHWDHWQGRLFFWIDFRLSLNLHWATTEQKQSVILG